MIPFPNKRYSVIYADPPWSYYNDMTVSSEYESGKCHGKGIKRPPYDVMSSKDICALPVSDIAENDSLLFLWTTDYHLRKAMEVISAWGFEYKTVGFVWQKLNKSGNPVCFMGSYTLKSGVELCLLGTRGSNTYKMVKSHNVRSLVSQKREEHSKKPDCVRDRIVSLVGGVPKIELFARQKCDGWDSWGNQLDTENNL